VGDYLYIDKCAIVSGTTFSWTVGLNVDNDADVRWYGSLDDWTPAGDYPQLVNKVGPGNAGYVLHMDYAGAGSGKLLFRWYDTSGVIHEEESTAKPTIADGALLWVRATLQVNDGAGHYVVKFYTSSDGTAWTQLGSTITGSSTTSIKAGNASVTLGEWSSITTRFPMKVYRAQIYNGIGGTLILDVDTRLASKSASTFLAGPDTPVLVYDGGYA
jgi:hypothetical protein